MADVKDAIKTAATVLAVIYIMNQFQTTRRLVYTAITGQN